MNEPDPADLAVLAAAPLRTGRYQTWRPEHGVPLGITVGRPKFWKHAEAPIDVPLLAPFGLLSPSISNAEAERRYIRRLDQRAASVVATLASIARQHSGRALVALCFEDICTQSCHRQWLSQWFGQRFGISVDEVDAG